MQFQHLGEILSVNFLIIHQSWSSWLQEILKTFFKYVWYFHSWHGKSKAFWNSVPYQFLMALFQSHTIRSYWIFSLCLLTGTLWQNFVCILTSHWAYLISIPLYLGSSFGTSIAKQALHSIQKNFQGKLMLVNVGKPKKREKRRHQPIMTSLMLKPLKIRGLHLQHKVYLIWYLNISAHLHLCYRNTTSYFSCGSWHHWKI